MVPKVGAVAARAGAAATVGAAAYATTVSAVVTGPAVRGPALRAVTGAPYVSLASTAVAARAA